MRRGGVHAVGSEGRPSQVQAESGQEQTDGQQDGVLRDHQHSGHEDGRAQGGDHHGRLAGSALTKLSTGSKTDHPRLSKVTQWGTNEWTSWHKAFADCLNMDVTATNIPVFANGIILEHMFLNYTSLVYNPSINNWDMPKL